MQLSLRASRVNAGLSDVATKVAVALTRLADEGA